MAAVYFTAELMVLISVSEQVDVSRHSADTSAICEKHPMKAVLSQRHARVFMQPGCVRQSSAHLTP